MKMKLFALYFSKERDLKEFEKEFYEMNKITHPALSCLANNILIADNEYATKLQQAYLNKECDMFTEEALRLIRPNTNWINLILDNKEKFIKPQPTIIELDEVSSIPYEFQLFDQLNIIAKRREAQKAHREHRELVSQSKVSMKEWHKCWLEFATTKTKLERDGCEKILEVISTTCLERIGDSYLNYPDAESETCKIYVAGIINKMRRCSKHNEQPSEQENNIKDEYNKHKIGSYIKYKFTKRACVKEIMKQLNESHNRIIDTFSKDNLDAHKLDLNSILLNTRNESYEKAIFGATQELVSQDFISLNELVTLIVEDYFYNLACIQVNELKNNVIGFSIAESGLLENNEQLWVILTKRSATKALSRWRDTWI